MPPKKSNMTKVPGNIAEMRALCRQNTPEAWNYLLKALRDPKTPKKLGSEIALAIIDRGWGKVTNHIEVKAELRAKHELSEAELVQIATRVPIDPKELPPKLRGDSTQVFEVDPVTGKAVRVTPALPERKKR